MPTGELQTRDLVIHARKATTEIRIDGLLDEWYQAEHVTFDDGGPISERRSATAYVLWDDNYLYIAFDVNKKDPKAKIIQRDGHGLWLDDGIEFLIDAKNDKGNMFMPDDIAYHINILDTVFDDRGTGGPRQDVSWNGNARHKTILKTAADGSVLGYVCEVAVPWEELGIVPHENETVMGIDFCVNGIDDHTGQYHYFDWAGLKLFHCPDGFGTLKLVGQRARADSV